MPPDGEIHFEVNTNGQAPRLRRPHQKTRTGCEACKARKIKCDEQLPRCSSCVKRDIQCVRPNQNGASIAPNSLSSSSPQPSLPSNDHELLTMRLFHHFEHCTLQTLPIGRPNVWEQTVELSLDYKYLMQSMLSLAAAHLHSMHPEDGRYEEAQLRHQSAAITELREALGRDITPQNSDALFACSVLLFLHAWTTADPDDIGFPAGLEDLVPLATGIKNMVMQAVLTRTSLFQETMAFSPRVALSMCAQGTAAPDELEALYKKQYHLAAPDDHFEQSWKFEAFMAECRRLIPVAAVLRLRQNGLDTKLLTHSIVRFLFTWPVLLGDGYFELMRTTDCLGLLILYHFFSAVAQADVPNMWWCRKRTNFVISALTKHFEDLRVPVVSVYGQAEKGHAKSRFGWLDQIDWGMQLLAGRSCEGVSTPGSSSS